MKSRKQIQFNAGKHQTGITVGTIFHNTKLPLTTWFQAIFATAALRSSGTHGDLESGQRA